MKIQKSNYTFSASGKTVTLSDETTLTLDQLLLVANVTRGIIYYDVGSVTRIATVSGNVITLNALTDTTGHADADKLIIVIEKNVGQPITNALSVFRDNFVLASPDTNIWNQSWTSQGSGLVNRGGDSSGSAYLRISMCPLTPGSDYLLESKKDFALPTRFATGISASQRILGQEFEVSLVGVDANGNVDNGSAISDIAISGTVTIASNVATINTATAHGLKGGDRVVLKGNTEKRLNVGPVVVTGVTATQFTVPCTLANGTYTAGGSIEWTDQTKRAKNAFGLLLENTTVTNASLFTRRNGSSIRSTNTTIATTNASQTNTSPYTDSWNTAAIQELIASVQEAMLISRASDSITAASGQLRYSQSLPDEGIRYKLRIRAKNLSNFSRPICRISNISKSASTTATVGTDVAHGLVVGDMIQIYGVLDQTNFANMTTSTAVATVIDANNFTVAFGASYTGSSQGGTVILNHGSVGLPGAINLSIASIVRTSNVMTVTMNTTATGLVPGEYCHLYGMYGSAQAYEGAYKVLRVTGSTYELESIGSDFTILNTGGAVIKRTDFRAHFLMEIEHTRLIAELINQHGSNDAARAMPISVSNSVTIGAMPSSTAIAGQAAVSAATSGNPVYVGGRTLTAQDTTLVAGDVGALPLTTAQQVITKPYGPAELDWTYPAAASGIVNTTTAVTVKAAAGASLRNTISSMQLSWDTLGGATEFVIRDGAAGTVIFRHKLPTVAGYLNVDFPTPLKGTANTLLEIATITGVTGGVYCNLQGATCI